ncbi:MAG: TerD family protein [Clostridiaceae bacterium]|nr:TerD family protein [Clostridiaceae bacterium]
MAVILQKGQKVDLTKGNAGLNEIMVGLGWDPVRRSGGLFGGLFGGTPQIDCDASVIMLDANGKFTNKNNLIYYGNLRHPSRSVEHMGDNLTGEGEGDDEQIHIYLNRIPPEIHRLVFVVNIYDCVNRRQDFGMIKNAFIRIVNSATRKEMLRFNLTEDYSGYTALIVGEVYRYNGEWKFSAIGQGTRDGSLSEIIRRYQ